MQLFHNEQWALWTLIISHINKEVIRHIQLDVNYADIDKHKDTYIWVLLKKKAITKGTYNL